MANNVVLEYAGTTHAAQGGTRFVSHALISERDSVNSVYVALSRGREANLAHVDSETEASQDNQPTVQDPVAALARILRRDEPGDALSALEARDAAIERAKSLRTLFPIWQDLDGEHSNLAWPARLASSTDAGFGTRVTTAPAWPTLAGRLHIIEAAGGDPEAALNAAMAARLLTGVADLVAVLHHRLAPQAAGETEPGRHLPFSLRPSGDSPSLLAMRQVAARIDQRIGELGERAAQKPPEWAARLGPVPTDTLARAEWPDRAALIASYREAFALEGSESIGQAPPPARPQARRWWTAANAALTGNQLPAAWASDEELAHRVAAGDQGETDRPSLVDLAGAAQCERDLQAELVYATEDHWQARTLPAVVPEHSAVAQRRVQDHPGGTARSQREPPGRRSRLPGLPAWDSRTATTGADAQAARRELARRNPPVNAESSLARRPPAGWPTSLCKPTGIWPPRGAPWTPPATPPADSRIASVGTPKPARPAKPTGTAPRLSASKSTWPDWNKKSPPQPKRPPSTPANTPPKPKPTPPPAHSHGERQRSHRISRTHRQRPAHDRARRDPRTE